jgi:hypothetical protein
MGMSVAVIYPTLIFECVRPHSIARCDFGDPDIPCMM